MILDDVNRGVTKHKKPKRLGRGIGSGQGKTAGRGHKGNKSRAGYSRRVTFQGGRMSVIMRIPKRGFNNRWGKTVAVVNLSQLEKAFTAGEEVTPDLLVSRNIAKGRFDELKILGDGDITKKLKVSAHRFSGSAKEKIEKAGGSVTVLKVATPVEEKKKAAAAEKGEKQPKAAKK